MKNLFLIGLLFLGLSTLVIGSDDHDHKINGHDNEKEEGKHSHHDHGEEEEGPKNIGKNKGVTSFDEEKGFTLSKEAMKNFSIKTQVLEGKGPWGISSAALLLTGEEKNIYRFRDGTFKRIDIEIIHKLESKIIFKSLELKSGDSVVVNGVGFIRTAEIDVTSGESGHHH